MDMKWLTAAGKALSVIVPGAQVVAPIISALFPKAAKAVDAVEDGLTETAKVVVQVETLGQIWGKAGEDKLDASVPPIANILMSRIVAGRKIKDQALFLEGSRAIASGMAQVLNSMSADAIEPKAVHP